MVSAALDEASAAFAAEEEEILALLLPEVARFLGGIDGHAIDERGAIPSSVRDEVARLGLFGLTLPREYGGAGLSLLAACRVVAEIARVDRSVAIMLGLHAGLGTRGLVELGSPSLRARWLPRLASGECVASFCATEAGAGSALTSIRTTGCMRDGLLEIEGEKSYVTNGGFAGLFTALVRTPGLGGERAHSLVCIPGDAPGVVRGAEEDKLGIRGSSTVTVTFDRVRVPLDHVLGAPGEGMQHAHRLLTWGRTLMSAGCVGSARGALEATIEHVLARRQFGSPIGDFPATRAHVAWMAARVHAMDGLVRSVARASASEETIDVDSAITKVFASEGAFEVCDRAVQLHGALGFLEDTGVPRMLRDTRVTRIFEGANDVLLLRIGTAALGQTGPFAVSRSRARFEPERALLDRLARELGAATGEMRSRWGVGAVKHQVALQRLARAAICLRAGQASVAALGDDATSASYAARTLAAEGHDWLRRLSSAEDEEEDVRELTEQLYGRDSEGRADRPDLASPGGRFRP